MKVNPFLHEFVSQAVFRLEENVPRIHTCLHRLTEEQIWHKPNAHSNCIGNLVVHLKGNITQYIHSTLGAMPDTRNRASEFEGYAIKSKTELLQEITACITQAIQIIKDLQEEAFLKTYRVQCFQLSGIGIIIHVVEHLSYHVGQISFFTKQMIDADLGYYKGMNL